MLASASHGRSLPIGESGSLYVEEEGEGPPIVFVHGLPGLGRDFRPLSERLRSDHRCITYDRRGYGRSAPAAAGSPIGVAAEAGCLLRLLDALDLEAAHLVGWSYGGAIAMETARTAPKRARSLVLMGSAGPSFGWPRGPINHLLFSTPLGGAAMRALLTCAPSLLRRPLDRAYGARAPETVFAAFLAGLAQPGTLDRWLAEGRAWDPATTVPEEIETPCLVVHGERDPQVPVSVARDLARRLPRAELLTLDDAGHWPFATHASRVDAAMRGFLAGSV
jgi:pimeloyl-ACP methyl ester carboxylesterase